MSVDDQLATFKTYGDTFANFDDNFPYRKFQDFVKSLRSCPRDKWFIEVLRDWTIVSLDIDQSFALKCRDLLIDCGLQKWEILLGSVYNLNPLVFAIMDDAKSGYLSFLYSSISIPGKRTKFLLENFDAGYFFTHSYSNGHNLLSDVSGGLFISDVYVSECRSTITWLVNSGMSMNILDELNQDVLVRLLLPARTKGMDDRLKEFIKIFSENGLIITYGHLTLLCRYQMKQSLTQAHNILKQQGRFTIRDAFKINIFPSRSLHKPGSFVDEGCSELSKLQITSHRVMADMPSKDFYIWQNLCRTFDQENIEELRSFARELDIPDSTMNKRELCAALATVTFEETACDNADEETLTDGIPVTELPSHRKYVKNIDGKNYCYDIADLYNWSKNSSQGKVLKDPYRRFTMNNRNAIEVRYKALTPRGKSIDKNTVESAPLLTAAQHMRQFASNIWHRLTYPISIDTFITATDDEVNGVLRDMLNYPVLRITSNEKTTTINTSGLQKKLNLLEIIRRQLDLNDTYTSTRAAAVELALSDNITLKEPRTLERRTSLPVHEILEPNASTPSSILGRRRRTSTDEIEEPRAQRPRTVGNFFTSFLGL
jgi:hypothetical protein